MLLALVAQFSARAEQGRGSPIGVFFAGGYWFDELTPIGRALLAGSWILAIIGLFVAMNGWGII